MQPTKKIIVIGHPNPGKTDYTPTVIGNFPTIISDPTEPSAINDIGLEIVLTHSISITAAESGQERRRKRRKEPRKDKNNEHIQKQ